MNQLQMPKTIGATDLQRKYSKVVKDLDSNPLFVMNRNEITGVLMSKEMYEGLIQTISDYEDELAGKLSLKLRKTQKKNEFVDYDPSNV